MRWGLGLALVIWLAGGQVGLAADPRAAEQKKDAVTVASVAVKPEAEAIAGKASGDKVVTIVAPEKMDRMPTPVTEPKRAGKKVRREAHRPSLVARIDLTHQRMHVSANGKLVGTWKISSGRGGYETPTGRFRPKWISRMHYSRKYDNSPMPYSVFFNGGIATHGTTAVSRLGQPASHGCIRLKTKNARTFFHLVRKHGKDRTRIVVTGHAKQSRIVRGTTTRRKRAATRRNTFRPENRVRANPYGRRRYSVNAYERRYRERVRRYYRSRRLVWPGDRY